jgi:DNA-binding beta-propeller fold protein YncE
MKRFFGITTLLLGTILLSPAPISRPSKASQSLASPSAPLTSAIAEQEPGETEGATAKQSGTLNAIIATHLAAADDKGPRKQASFEKAESESPDRRNESRAVRIEPVSIEIAFVANAQAGAVAMVDVASRSVIGTIDVNPAHTKSRGPGAPNYAQDTDVAPDGRTLYVSRGYLGDVAAFDIASGRLLWQRSLNTGRADHMTITRDGHFLFVSALMDNRVYKVATAAGEIMGHIVTGIFPHDNKVSKDGRRLYNTSIGPIGTLPRKADAQPLTDTPGFPFQLTVADADTLQIRDRIKLDNAFRPWRFTPDEKGIYAQLSNEHAVVAYDLSSRKVVKRLELPVKPGVTVADWDFEAPHHGLALTPDGKTLCLAGRASDYAALVRAPELTLIATIPVGDAPGWAEIADNGQVCLIANTRSDDLSIISIAKRTEIARLPIGDGPKHITVARIPASVIAAFKVRH